MSIELQLMQYGKLDFPKELHSTERLYNYEYFEGLCYILLGDGLTYLLLGNNEDHFLI